MISDRGSIGPASAGARRPGSYAKLDRKFQMTTRRHVTYVLYWVLVLLAIASFVRSRGENGDGFSVRD